MLNSLTISFFLSFFLSPPQVKATANHAVLGKRLRGDAKKVSAAVSALTKAEIEKYQHDGFIDVCGHKLTVADNDIEISYTVSDT